MDSGGVALAVDRDRPPPYGAKPYTERPRRRVLSSRL